jgi:glycosyltransferase involved in cell wall biosynthesis
MLPGVCQGYSIRQKKQQIPFDEILVYNDCSTDDTAVIAREYGATVITGDVNIGCSAGKNSLAIVAKPTGFFLLMQMMNCILILQ